MGAMGKAKGYADKAKGMATDAANEAMGKANGYADKAKQAKGMATDAANEAMGKAKGYADKAKGMVEDAIGVDIVDVVLTASTNMKDLSSVIDLFQKDTNGLDPTSMDMSM